METIVPVVILNSRIQLITHQLPHGGTIELEKRFFELNGVIMYEDDMCFFLQMLGFIAIPLTGLELSFKVQWTLEQLTEEELAMALAEYSSHTDEDRRLLQDYLSYMEPIVTKLEPN